MSNRVLAILAFASIAWVPSLGVRAQSTDLPAAQTASSWSSPSLRNGVLDRSHLRPPGAVESVMKEMKMGGDAAHQARQAGARYLTPFAS